GPVRVAAGEDVVLVGRGRACPLPVDRVAFVIDEQLDVAVKGVQLSQIVGDDDTVGVRPGPFADAVDRVLSVVARGAQIRTPRAAAGAHFVGQGLAQGIGALDAAEIAAAVAGRGDEEPELDSPRVTDASIAVVPTARRARGTGAARGTDAARGTGGTGAARGTRCAPGPCAACIPRRAARAGAPPGPSGARRARGPRAAAEPAAVGGIVITARAQRDDGR